jgi:predicted nucleic acid-binding protein
MGGILIIIMAVIFGFTTGYLSYLFTFRQEKLALQTQRLCNVRRVLTEIIITKRTTKIEFIRNKVKAILSIMNIMDESNPDNSPNRIFDGITRLIPPAEDSPFFHLYNKLHANIIKNIKKIMHDKGPRSPDLENNYNSTDFLLNNSLTSATYIRILTKSEDASRNKIPKVHNWLRTNISGIAVGLLPTFLGSFASMFVFLNGFPTLVDNLHVEFGLSVIRTFIQIINLTSVLNSWNYPRRRLPR